MAAETPSFNSTGENGLTPLMPQNSAMSGLLASSGNAVSVIIEAPTRHRQQWSSPGQWWVAQRLSGRAPQRIVWRWAICCENTQGGTTAEQKMNAVEAALVAYMLDGRGYTMDDGKGQTRLDCVLCGHEAGTQRIGPRLTLTNGNKLQQWELVFVNLRWA
jgi:hypothetical protein